MEELARGSWFFIGIVAEAIVSTNAGISNLRFHAEIQSEGVWGVPYKCSNIEHIKELNRREIKDLRERLIAHGVDLCDFEELSANALEETKNVEYD